MTRLELIRLALRWSARLTAGLLLVMVLIIVVGEGVFGGGGPNFAKMDWPRRLQFAVEFLAVSGFAVIWWRELFGGLLVLVCTALFYWLNFRASGMFPGGAFPLFYIPGALAIVSWILSLPARIRKIP
jgi:hypothetical protein